MMAEITYGEGAQVVEKKERKGGERSMKPVMQTKFGKEGNCTQACICSILELPIEDAPDVPDEKYWMTVINRWLEKKGLVLMVVSTVFDSVDGRRLCVKKPRVYPMDCYYVVGGRSPRGIGHSVVFQGEVMVHDPHPEGGGVADVTDLYFICPKIVVGPEVTEIAEAQEPKKEK
jgi:hypothetical protein